MRDLIVAIGIYLVSSTSYAQLDPTGRFIAIDSTSTLAKASDHFRFPKYILAFSNDTVHFLHYPPDPAGILNYSAATFEVHNNEIITDHFEQIAFSLNIGRPIYGRFGCQGSDTFIISKDQIRASVLNSLGHVVEITLIRDENYDNDMPILRYLTVDPKYIDGEKFVKCE